jgi:hypothetical protein
MGLQNAGLLPNGFTPRATRSDHYPESCLINAHVPLRAAVDIQMKVCCDQVGESIVRANVADPVLWIGRNREKGVGEPSLPHGGACLVAARVPLDGRFSLLT